MFKGGCTDHFPVVCVFSVGKRMWNNGMVHADESKTAGVEDVPLSTANSQVVRSAVGNIRNCWGNPRGNQHAKPPENEGNLLSNRLNSWKQGF